MLEIEQQKADSIPAETDLPPVQCLGPSTEAPHDPCAMLGDEAMTQPGAVPGSEPLCPRCKQSAHVDQLKTIGDFTRWLRASGFSRSVATKIAGHGWPKEAGESADTMNNMELLAAVEAMTARFNRDRN